MIAIVDDDQLDRVFHALANRTRRALIRQLSNGAAKVTDLAEPFGMSLNAVSKHLAVLENAGIVRRQVSGRVHLCSLQAGPMASADQWLATYEQYWNQRLDHFAAFVEAKGNKP